MDEHAQERMTNRISKVGFEVDVQHLRKLAKRYSHGKTYARIGYLDKWTYESETDSYGNCIVAIIYFGQVKTIMLSDKLQRWNDGQMVVDIQ